jgi:hypothetical protein
MSTAQTAQAAQKWNSVFEDPTPAGEEDSGGSSAERTHRPSAWTQRVLTRYLKGLASTRRRKMLTRRGIKKRRRVMAQEIQRRASAADAAWADERYLTTAAKMFISQKEL